MASVQTNSSTNNLAPKAWDTLTPPFTSRFSLLTTSAPRATTTTASPNTTSSLPAPSPDDILLASLEKELAVPRLNRIHKYLWLVGRAGNIRPLHRQKALEREIIITEEADLHLVWDGSRIFIKPLPKLLGYKFFGEHLCSRDSTVDRESFLYQNTCGFLLSYTYLIRHESDFRIARDLGLISPSLDITWEEWSVFAAEIQANIERKNVNKRYIYGELRMTRLNLIYRLLLGDLRGFYYGYTRYVSFFRSNFGWLLLAFAYVSVVLAAMQTVLSSSFGQDNTQMRNVFGVFSFAVVMAVTGILILVLLLFVGAFLANFIVTLRHKRQQDEGSSVSLV